MSKIIHYTLNNPKRLPRGYQPLDWIEATGTQYINTGYYLDWTKDINIWLDIDTTDTINDGSWKSIFGYRRGSNEALCVFIRPTEIALDYYGGGGFTITPGRHHLYIQKTKFTVDGLSKNATWTYPDSLTTAYYPLWIGQGAGNPGIRNNKLRIHKVVINNGTVTHTYLPAIRANDLKIGMFDINYNQFYPDAAGGNFVAGPLLSLENEYNQVTTDIPAFVSGSMRSYSKYKFPFDSFTPNYTTVTRTNNVISFPCSSSNNINARFRYLNFNGRTGNVKLSLEAWASKDVSNMQFSICDSAKITRNLTTTPQLIQGTLAVTTWTTVESGYDGFIDIAGCSDTSVTIYVKNITLLWDQDKKEGYDFSTTDALIQTATPLPTTVESYSFWIYLPTNVSTTTTNQIVFTDAANGIGFGFYSTYCIMGANAGPNRKVKTAFTQGWHHVVILKQNARLFVDGIEQENASGAEAWSGSNTNALEIGLRTTGNNYPFNGCLSDFQIYDHALSEEDIKILAGRG